jgi:hypothetical protein
LQKNKRLKNSKVAGGPKSDPPVRLAGHFIARINYEIKCFLQAPFSASDSLAAHFWQFLAVLAILEISLNV